MKQLNTLDKYQAGDLLRPDLQRIHDDEPASGLAVLLDSVTPYGINTASFFAQRVCNLKTNI